MRRLLVPLCGLVLAVSLAVASAEASPFARSMRADKDLISLERGRGLAALTVKGATLGSVRRGSVRVRDLPRGVKTTIKVFGAEHVKRVDRHTKLYSGRGISFRVQGGWWQVRLIGRGINASAVARGVMVLAGSAGSYRINDGDRHAWPMARRSFSLG